MRHRLIPLAIASVLFASTASAQTITPPDQLAGFLAILFTPAGALPHVVTVPRVQHNHSVGGAALRYGRYTLGNSGNTFNNLGLSGWLGLGDRAQIGGTIGQRTCTSCEGLIMGSVDVGATVFHKRAAGDVGGDTDFGIQLSAGAGKARKSDVSARSFMLSAPVSVTLPQAENAMLSLFLSPSVAYGSLSDTGVTRGAARLMIGAGVAYALDNGLGIHFAVHRVLINDSPTQIGLAVAWAFGPRPK